MHYENTMPSRNACRTVQNLGSYSRSIMIFICPDGFTTSARFVARLHSSLYIWVTVIAIMKPKYNRQPVRPPPSCAKEERERERERETSVCRSVWSLFEIFSAWRAEAKILENQMETGERERERTRRWNERHLEATRQSHDRSRRISAFFVE